MKFKERQTQYPNRMRFIKVDNENQPIQGEPTFLINLVKEEGEILNYPDGIGTVISAENLNKGNWRDDDSISFSQSENSQPLSSVDGKTQIMTLSNGRTYLIPPGQNKQALQLDKTAGSIVIENGTVIDEWNADTKQNTIELQPNRVVVSNVEGKITESNITNTELGFLSGFTSSIQNQFNSIINTIYPIGAIYISVNPANPTTFLGGTWVEWAAGRVPVGLGNNGETNYTLPDVTGGSENSVAYHNHLQNPHTHIQSLHGHTQAGHKHGLWTPNTATWSANVTTLNDATNGGSVGGLDKPYTSSGFYCQYVQNNKANAVSTETPIISETTAINQNQTATNQASGVTGGNRMPFITCYMWKRIQ